MSRTEDREERVVLVLPCLHCGETHEFDEDSYEARGVFNVFCPGGECEDRYAATL